MSEHQLSPGARSKRKYNTCAPGLVLRNPNVSVNRLNSHAVIEADTVNDGISPGGSASAVIPGLTQLTHCPRSRLSLCCDVRAVDLNCRRGFSRPRFSRPLSLQGLGGGGGVIYFMHATRYSLKYATFVTRVFILSTNPCKLSDPGPHPAHRQK